MENRLPSALFVIFNEWIFQEKCDTYSAVVRARELQPRNQNNDTLLHMSVNNTSNNSVIPHQALMEDDKSDMFPSEAVVQFLLECGFDANTKNDAGETPLHVAAKKVKYQKILNRGIKT